jgi:hypothetical protein
VQALADQALQAGHGACDHPGLTISRRGRLAAAVRPATAGLPLPSKPFRPPRGRGKRSPAVAGRRAAVAESAGAASRLPPYRTGEDARLQPRPRFQGDRTQGTGVDPRPTIFS